MLRCRRKAGWLLATAVYVGLAADGVAAQERPTISIIGTGNLASALGPALGREGYTVVYGSRNPARESVSELVERTGDLATATSQQDAAEQTDFIVLAVPEEVLFEVTGNLGDLDGKVVVTVAGGEGRVAADGYLELTQDSTYSQRLQSRHPSARIVRMNLPTIVYFLEPLLVGTPPTVLLAGNDPRARATVAQVVFDLGLNPWDAGPIRFSRVFNEMNWMLSIPAQQGRTEQYELNLMPSVPFSCFFDVTEEFGYGRPNELDDLVEFPRREPVIPCEEWLRRLEEWLRMLGLSGGD